MLQEHNSAKCTIPRKKHTDKVANTTIVIMAMKYHQKLPGLAAPCNTNAIHRDQTVIHHHWQLILQPPY
jgi:hypothetical protein